MSKYSVVLWEMFAKNYLYQTLLKVGH